MSRFTTPLIGYFDDAMEKFTTTEEFDYHVGTYPSSDIIKVPSGFVTDFASVPKIIQWLIHPHGRYGKAAVLHDYLYENAIKSKAYADNVFYEAMGVLGVSQPKRWVMYQAVKRFGKGKYK